MSDILLPSGQPFRVDIVLHPTDKAKTKPNHYKKPGDGGNCVGCVYPKPSPNLSAPNDKPETEQESGWDKFVNGAKEAAKDGAQWYKDNVSESLHQFGSDAMSTGGNIATAGGGAAAVGGAMVATGIGAAPGAVIAAGGGATAAVGGGVSAVGAGADSAATVLDSAADWAITGKAPNVIQPAIALGQRLLTSLVLKKVPGLGGKGGVGQQAGGSTGGYVTGGGRCRLRRYKEGCSEGRTPHHVVPDHVFKQPGDGSYYPAGTKHPSGFKHADGWTVCASGKTKSSKPDGARAKKGAFARVSDWFNALDEHGKIHALLDPAETALGAVGDPKGTTTLGEMEAAGVAAAAKVLGCDPASMLADLRSKHQADGLPIDMKVRADPTGIVRNLNPARMGTAASGSGHGGN